MEPMKKPAIKLGTLIENTMRPMDVIPTMINECIRRGLKWEKVIEASNEQWSGPSLLGTSMMWVTGLSGEKKVAALQTDPWWTLTIENGQGWTNHDENNTIRQELIDLLNEDLVGCEFGVHPNDGACLGYWSSLGDSEDAGKIYSWKPHYGNLIVKQEGGKDILFQGDDVDIFLRQTGEVNFIWDQDPENTKGRVFKTREEHLDAIAEPYFNNQ